MCIGGSQNPVQRVSSGVQIRGSEPDTFIRVLHRDRVQAQRAGK